MHITNFINTKLHLDMSIIFFPQILSRVTRFNTLIKLQKIIHVIEINIGTGTRNDMHRK